MKEDWSEAMLEEWKLSWLQHIKQEEEAYRLLNEELLKQHEMQQACDDAANDINETVNLCVDFNAEMIDHDIITGKDENLDS